MRPSSSRQWHLKLATGCGIALLGACGTQVSGRHQDAPAGDDNTDAQPETTGGMGGDFGGPMSGDGGTSPNDHETGGRTGDGGASSGGADQGSDGCAVSSRPCDEHPEIDGTGICRAGMQTCSVDAQGEESWSECFGRVGPLPETCGPTAEDANCDGVVGNGKGCVVTVKLFSNSASPCPLEGNTYAGTTAPDTSFVEFAELRLFNANPEGDLVPVRNCIATWSFMGAFHDEPFVTQGDCSPHAELNTIGYVSPVQAQGYGSLEAGWSAYETVGGRMEAGVLPLPDCPASCSCSGASQTFSP